MRRCTVRCSRSAKKSCSNITRSRARFIRIACRRSCRIGCSRLRRRSRTLRELHAARNHRPVADTIGRLIAVTRAHAGFILWRGGEQVLANVLHISDLARRYELGRRPVVPRLRRHAARRLRPRRLSGSADPRRGQRRRAADDRAQGQGPRVPDRRARRHRLQVEPRRCVAVSRSGEASSARFASADGRRSICRSTTPRKRSATKPKAIRLAYVAATRARDLLVVPAVGDGPYDKGWVRPLNRALYPPREQWQSPSPARGVPLFKGKQTIMAGRARRRAAGRRHRAPGHVSAHRSRIRARPIPWSGGIRCCCKAAPDDARGVRREDLISKDANAADVAADRANYDRWRERRAAVQASGSAASMQRRHRDASSPRSPAQPKHAITIEDAGFGAIRPSGKRFGTLVHAVLATLPLERDGGRSQRARGAACQVVRGAG